jgi:hypothetical protein
MAANAFRLQLHPLARNLGNFFRTLEFSGVLRLLHLLAVSNKQPGVSLDLTEEPTPGRWYDARIDRTCAMLTNVGYEIIDRDVGTLLRDPIIHFRKPFSPSGD